MTYHTVKKPRIGEYIIPGTTVIWQAMQLTETHQPAQRTYEIGKGGSLKTTWWKVDLGKVKSIYSVQIDFKKYEGFG